MPKTFPLPWAEAKAKADVLKALGNPVRVLLVEALSKSGGELAEYQLNECVPVHQTTLSRHLTQLKKAGIVAERRAGNRMMHALIAPGAVKTFAIAAEVVKSDHQRRQRGVQT